MLRALERGRCLRPTVATAALSVAVIAASRPATATYSILAFDERTQRFGVATASCVGLDTLRQVYGQVPSKGAVATQSYLLEVGGGAQQKALQALSSGDRAKTVLAQLLEPSYDPEFAKRQYLILDARGGLATFTGDLAHDYSGDLSRTGAGFVVAAGGNFLTGKAVLQRALNGFFDSSACDLPARLEQALAAASKPGLGDVRCSVLGVSAESAWISVGPKTLDSLDIQVQVDPSLDDPVAELRRRFATWRQAHPCPAGGASIEARQWLNQGRPEPHHRRLQCRDARRNELWRCRIDRLDRGLGLAAPAPR